jgi:hypothetical protein
VICAICRLDIDDPEHMRRVHSREERVERAAALLDTPTDYRPAAYDRCDEEGISPDEQVEAKALADQRRHQRFLRRVSCGDPAHGGGHWG